MTALQNDLLAERNRRGWSQSRMAELAGVSRQSYAAIEAGSSVPSTEVALRLADGLGRRVEELFRLPGSQREVLRCRLVGRTVGRGQRVRVARVGGAWRAVFAGGQGTGACLADGVVVGGSGEEAEVSLFADRPRQPSLLVAGCDPAFGIVAEALRRERGLEVAWVHLASRRALEALAAGDVHIAGVHLSGAGEADANGRLVAELVPFGCVRVTFAVWEQGLIVGPGNPAGIRGVEDLGRGDVRILNREMGSGSRMLLDRELERSGLKGTGVGGYETVASGHYAIAEAVASGLVHTGVAIRAAASAYGLESIPLSTERYELVIPRHFLDLPAVDALLDLLGRRTLRDQIDSFGGYDVAEMGRTR